MLTINAENYEEFLCMVDQNFANHKGWSGQTPVVVCLTSDPIAFITPTEKVRIFRIQHIDT